MPNRLKTALFVMTRTVLLAFLFGCSDGSKQSTEQSWQNINAREEAANEPRSPLYRALAPISWICHTPSPSDSLLDTTKSVCEFFIQDGTEKLRLTIHTFPVNEVQPRIPPLAQITRWKTQFEELDPLTIQVIPQSQGGFVGLLLEAEGLYQGQLQKMLGWSMQLAPEYDRQLQNKSDLLKNRLRRADYTIKIVGPTLLINKHRKALLHFANSFELIDELPTPL
ncbi:conserved hypothetical protein [Candidatus Protochlamydia naegleriophila]|uniref:Uncharacterized protein n=1 Tax=Candidatus Protochlamydia naegleriophila TaxID=389348 RepID=A0A0U5JDE1_9BACT|nr:hypothetical protein [Candidatus Protochlamydia naegleriophila]CUI16415.1 conserved hypothetical protein [Candidatus Protochlamydia naegleriophila]